MLKCVCVVAIIKLTFFCHCCFASFLIRIQIGKGPHYRWQAWPGLTVFGAITLVITTLLFIAKLVRIVVGFDFGLESVCNISYYL